MELLHLATFLVAFISSILSGIAGGGGGYLVAPYWLLSGMTPAEGATTGSFMAIGMGASSLAAFRKTDHFPRHNRLTVLLVCITIIASIVGAVTLTHINMESFRILLAVITLLSLPMLFIDRRKIVLTKRHRYIAVGLFVVLLFVSSVITSSAFSILIAVGLSQLFGLTLLQSTALRRVIGLVQSIVIFFILAFQGNLLLFHALAAIIGGSAGSYIGTKIAINKGERFAKYALAVGAVMGAVALLV